jgi:hypothetical protein
LAAQQHRLRGQFFARMAVEKMWQKNAEKMRKCEKIIPPPVMMKRQ